MKEKQTKKGKKGFSSLASLLPVLFGLVIISTLSYAKTNSSHPAKFTLTDQNLQSAREFSIKRQVNASYVWSVTKKETSTTSQFPEYMKNASFLSSRMFEERQKEGGEIRLGKPPLNTGKVAGELLAGCVLGSIAGIGGAYLGASISILDTGRSFGDIIASAGLGMMAAYPLGCALGVYLVGNLGNETGSFGSALLGAYGGMVVWGGSAIALNKLSPTSSTVASLAFLVIPPLFATLAFNKSRRYKNPQAVSASLLNFRDGKMDIGFPAIRVLPSAPGSSKLDWEVNLASVEF